MKKQIRATPQVGIAPYRQVHAHSTGNKNSTAQNEADYMSTKDLTSGFYTHVVGQGEIIQTAEVNRGAFDVGNEYNYETYSAWELTETQTKTKEQQYADYKIWVNGMRADAKQGGIPCTLDSADLSGIKTHEWCTIKANTYGGHVDPYPYLVSIGITREQFKRDVENGFIEELPKKEIKNMIITFTNKKTAYALIDGRLIPFTNGVTNYNKAKAKADIDFGDITDTQLKLIINQKIG